MCPHITTHKHNQFLCSFNLSNCFQLVFWDVLLFETIESKYVKLQTMQKYEFYFYLKTVVLFQKVTKPELCIIFSLKKKILCATFLDFPLITIHPSYYTLQS